MAEESLESEPRGLKDLFTPWLSSSSLDEARFFERAVIALDANVLLELYRISSATRDEMLELLSEVKERIWIPHQAALEYARNRKGSVRDSNKNVTDIKNKINGHATKSSTAIKDALKEIDAFRDRHRATGEWDPKANGSDVDALLDSLESLWKEAKKEVVRVKDEIELSSENPDDDAILGALEGLLRGRIGEPFNASELRKHVDHATDFRFPNKIPPGYKDVDKDTDLEKAGDYIMWRQLLDYMGRLDSEQERILIFVTNDFKPDWWTTGDEDENWMPAPELILEMQSEADAELLMLSSSDFLAGAAKYLSREVSREAVDELKKDGQREATFATGVLKDPDFRAALNWGQMGVSPEARALMDQVGQMGVSPEARALMDQVGQMGVSPETRALMDQMRRRIISPETRALMDQMRRRIISPETQAAADSVLKNPGLMKAIRDAQKTMDGMSNLNYGSDEDDQDFDEDDQD